LPTPIKGDAERFGSDVSPIFASDENVAVFGDFRYKSHSLGKTVMSPISILVKVVDGKVTYIQFLEDSYATAASFRKSGSRTRSRSDSGSRRSDMERHQRGANSE
jgi:hypothetical protein